jgi:hypothetical protein
VPKRLASTLQFSFFDNLNTLIARALNRTLIHPSYFQIGLQSRARPLPVSDLWFVQTLLVGVVDIFDDLSLEPLLELSARSLQFRDTINYVDCEVKRSTWLRIASSNRVLMFPFSLYPRT